MSDFLKGMYEELTDQDPDDACQHSTLDFFDDVIATGWDCYMNPRPGRDPAKMDFESLVPRTDVEHAAAMSALAPPPHLMGRLMAKDERMRRDGRRGKVRVFSARERCDLIGRGLDNCSLSVEP